MKRTIALILTLVLVLGLCACGGSGEKKMEGLHVGYSRQSIMPEVSVGMGGYADHRTRGSNGFIDMIYTTCIAFTEGEETVLIFTEDLLGKEREYVVAAREMLTEATGIPGDHIMFANTHNHNGPAFYPAGLNFDKYLPVYYAAVKAAAEAALADRAPATLYGTKTEVPGMNFIRHFIEHDGDYTSANNGTFVLADTKGHVRDADPEMVLMKIDREGEDKKDIMLMNWAAHPCTVGKTSYTMLSAEYIGVIRDTVEAQTDMLFAFFQAAGGDVVTDSLLPDLAHGLDRIGYGEALAKSAIDAMPNLEKIEGSGIKVSHQMKEYGANVYGADRLQEAKAVVALPGATRDTAHLYGFDSLKECEGIVNRENQKPTNTMELDAIYVAGAAFTTASWEMFSKTGKDIKEGSPFKYTMVLTCANGKDGYIPIAEAYDYPCYELFVSNFVKGTAENAANELISMLKSFQ